MILRVTLKDEDGNEQQIETPKLTCGKNPNGVEYLVALKPDGQDLPLMADMVSKVELVPGNFVVRFVRMEGPSLIEN